MGRFIEHTTINGTDLSDDENAEGMMKTFMNLPVEVVSQAVSKKHEEFSKCLYAEYFPVTIMTQLR